jgi:predicted dienelactone hydrolase
MMQLFEALFLIILSMAIIRLIVGPIHSWFRYSFISFAGFVVLLFGLILEGWRWQMIPAYFGFAVLILAGLKKDDVKLYWRLLGAIPLIALVGFSAVLAQLMPIVSLPAPSGPYGVGTFDFSITDSSRIERYAPERNRELYVEVWYPADKASLEKFPVRTLFHDLYRGDYNRTSFLFGYVKHIDTHSHIQASVAESNEGPFPVLLFNHAKDFGFTSQNQLLMEHLASHGYVIFSIAHPYQTAKVNLADAGTVFRADNNPGDINLPRPKISTSLIGTIFNETNDIKKVSEIKTLLYPLSEKYVSLADKDKPGFLTKAVYSPEFEPFKLFVTEELLQDFIDYEYIKEGSMVQYWVEDNQFIADSLPELQTPVAGFAEIMNLDRLGVIGMSYGGSAAGEFCKIDSRCKAGVNLDGTQWGRHWDKKLPVPFLMLYNDEHQGGNDFAYLPPVADFWDYRVKGSMHTDFTDFVYLWPILKKIDFSGNIEGMRMMEILNTVQLDFLDRYLKGKTIRTESHANFLELDIRNHDVEN